MGMGGVDNDTFFHICNTCRPVSSDQIKQLSSSAAACWWWWVKANRKLSHFPHSIGKVGKQRIDFRQTCVGRVTKENCRPAGKLSRDNLTTSTQHQHLPDPSIDCRESKAKPQKYVWNLNIFPEEITNISPLFKWLWNVNEASEK